MAPESRIGLVVGLAFIVCFAIILANRGQPRAPVPEAMLEPGLPKPNLTPTPQRSPHLVRSVLPSRTTTTEPLPKRSTTEEPAAVDSAVTTRNPRVVALDVPSDGAQVTSTRLIHSGDERLLRSVAPRRSDRGSASFHHRDDRQRKGIHVTVQHPNTAVSDRGGAPKSNPGKETTGRLVHYTVVAGDTLSKIVATHYGTRSAKVVRSVFRANRAVLTSPDMLPIGAALTLPGVEGTHYASIAAPARQVRTSAVPTRQTPRRAKQRQASFRWYQVKKKDHYVRIAREQLGDPNRWREIYELNKDKFPDSNRIREGVRIKLPVSSGAGTGGV